MASQAFRADYGTAPVVITTSGSDNEATLPAGWWKLGVSGTPANIRYQGNYGVLVKGSTTAKMTFTAIVPVTEVVTVTALATSMSLPLSVSVSGTDITIQLGATSTADQVAAAVQGLPAANALVSVVAGSGSGGGGTAAAFAKADLELPAATSADPLFPIGIEDMPIYRAGEVHALGTSSGGQVFFLPFKPN